MWVLLLVIIIVVLWIMRDPIRIRWELHKTKNEMMLQLDACDRLNAELKQKNDAIGACKANSANCTQVQSQQQMALTSAGIGDSQSELSHIRNELTSIGAALIAANESADDALIKSLNDRLAETHRRLSLVVV